MSLAHNVVGAHADGEELAEPLYADAPLGEGITGEVTLFPSGCGGDLYRPQIPVVSESYSAWLRSYSGDGVPQVHVHEYPVGPCAPIQAAPTELPANAWHPFTGYACAVVDGVVSSLGSAAEPVTHLCAETSESDRTLALDTWRKVKLIEAGWSILEIFDNGAFASCARCAWSKGGKFFIPAHGLPDGAKLAAYGHNPFGSGQVCAPGELCEVTIVNQPTVRLPDDALGIPEFDIPDLAPSTDGPAPALSPHDAEGLGATDFAETLTAFSARVTASPVYVAVAALQVRSVVEPCQPWTLSTGMFGHRQVDFHCVVIAQWGWIFEALVLAFASYSALLILLGSEDEIEDA
ncbi:MAG: hypothetical protein AAF417_21890 [Pseudomonadota bacterium]